jgi:hypothetical protein
LAFRTKKEATVVIVAGIALALIGVIAIVVSL